MSDLCLSKFEKNVAFYQALFLFSFSQSLFLSPLKQTDGKNEDVQTGCSFSVRLLLRCGIGKGGVLETQFVHEASQPLCLGCLCITGVLIIHPKQSHMRPEEMQLMEGKKNYWQIACLSTLYNGIKEIWISAGVKVFIV